MKITIVGKANGWKDAPYEGIVWGIHSHCLERPFTMVWDMHKIDGTDIERGCSLGWHREIIEHINKNKIPYMTLKKHDNIPTSIEFPIDEMELKYSESSVSYMIWYAYHMGATEIELYGVNMSNTDEYEEQLKSTDYWIGYARGKGIKVTVNEPTSVCKGMRGLYGYDFVNPSYMGTMYQAEDRYVLDARIQNDIDIQAQKRSNAQM